MKHIRKDFPFFANNPGLVYCDSAATTQKPQQVIDRVQHFYAHENAPIHRGLYGRAEQATQQYEAVREQVRAFVGADDASEIIFTANATAGINLVAHAWARNVLKSGDEIVLSELEHHANVVPWLMVAQATGARVRYIPVGVDGDLEYADLGAIITKNAKIVAVAAISNVTGAEVDLATIAAHAHEVGAAVLVDACQSAMRREINVNAQNFDFLVFSGHKLLAPAGVGVLFARKKFHGQMRAIQGGGGAVLSVDYDRFSWREVPYCFEAGTPDSAAVLGLGEALTYIRSAISPDSLRTHEASLCQELLEGLGGCKGVRIVGPIDHLARAGHLVSFTINGLHAHDVAAYCDKRGIAVRSGHHCAQPLHTKFGIAASVRVSFCCYNSSDDVRAVLAAVRDLAR